MIPLLLISGIIAVVGSFLADIYIDNTRGWHSCIRVRYTLLGIRCMGYGVVTLGFGLLLIHLVKGE